MAFTQITLTGTLTQPNGAPILGTFTATLSGTMTNGSTVVEPAPLAGILTGPGNAGASDPVGTAQVENLFIAGEAIPKPIYTFMGGIPS